MTTYYFVGGPVAGHHEAFFGRLAELGGTPTTWGVYPHASGDGKALHLVHADNEDAILAHIDQFGPLYEHGPIVEVVERPGSHEGRPRRRRRPGRGEGVRR